VQIIDSLICCVSSDYQSDLALLAQMVVRSVTSSKFASDLIGALIPGGTSDITLQKIFHDYAVQWMGMIDIDFRTTLIVAFDNIGCYKEGTRFMWTAQRNPVTCLVEGYHDVTFKESSSERLIQNQTKHGPSNFKDMAHCPENFYKVTMDVDEDTSCTAEELIQAEIL
jgi:hypothetical protein